MSTILQLGEKFYQSHITFQSVSAITEMTKPLNAIGLSYFTFDRTYQDGSHLRLTNAGRWIEAYYRNELYNVAIFEKDPRLFTNGYVFWSWLNREPIYSAAAKYNIDHGLTLIQVHDNYSDFFHFGTTCNNYIAAEILIEKLPFLYRFIAYFKQQARHLIAQAETERFKLPVLEEKQIHLANLQAERGEGEQALNEWLQKTEVTRLYLGDKFDNAYLTRREMDIFWLLKDGEKPTDIAKRLNLSHRTLETHIKNLKDKLKCSTLFELGFVLGSFGAQNIYPFTISST